MSQYFIVSGGVTEPERTGTARHLFRRVVVRLSTAKLLWCLTVLRKTHFLCPVLLMLKSKRNFKKGSKGVTVFLLIIEVNSANKNNRSLSSHGRTA